MTPRRAFHWLGLPAALAVAVGAGAGAASAGAAAAAGDTATAGQKASATAGAALAAARGDSYVSYSGTALAQRSGQFLYSERHVLQYRDGRMAGRVVLYTCRDGSAFARKTVSYGDLLSPDFVLEDASNGMREGVRTGGGGREVFFRDGAAAEKRRPIPQSPGLVADSGFDAFVRANWQPLMDGRTLGMRFLVPSRLDDMGFNVQHVGSGSADGVPVEIFRLKLSGVVGWVAPSIDVYYGAADRTLVRYVGLSDLRDGSHANFHAEIEFRPGDRRPDDAETMISARTARLAPCR